jgi:hypothetical protein
LRLVIGEIVALTVCFSAVIAAANRFVESFVEELGDDTSPRSRANGFHFPLEGASWAQLHALNELMRGRTRLITGLIDVESRALGFDTFAKAHESNQGRAELHVLLKDRNGTGK